MADPAINPRTAEFNQIAQDMVDNQYRGVQREEKLNDAKITAQSVSTAKQITS